MKNQTHDIVVVIGNGFDLNLGLKTGYQDFIASSYFKNLVNADNILCQHLQSQYHLQRWIDIEKELQIYSHEHDQIDRERFREEYIGLCDALCDYINSLDISAIDRTSYAYDRLKSTLSVESALIIDFNYTKSIEYIVGELGLPCKCDIIKIHGNAYDRSIVFGVEDDARINPEDVFLLKAAHKNYTAIDVNAHLEKAKALIVLGHSLGQSDYHYFTDFFRKQSLAHASSKHMLITYFQERSRLEIMKSLVELSGHALSQLRTKNRFQMVDLSEYLPEPNYLPEP